MFFSHQVVGQSHHLLDKDSRDVTLDNLQQSRSVSADTVKACNAYTWLVNGVTYHTSGEYAHLDTTAAGVDTAYYLQLEIVTIDASISQSGDTLRANATGVNYQWLDCSNGYLPIIDAYQRSFYPPQSGIYAVEVSNDVCTDRSSCQTVLFTGIQEVQESNRWEVFPNPFQERITISGNVNESVDVFIRNAQGSLLHTYSANGDADQYVEITGAPGLYFIEIRTENDTQVFPLIKY